jgi:hypothetical protein
MAASTSTQELARELELYYRFICDVEQELHDALRGLGDSQNREAHTILIEQLIEAVRALAVGNEGAAAAATVEVGKQWRAIRTHTRGLVGQGWLEKIQQDLANDALIVTYAREECEAAVIARVEKDCGHKADLLESASQHFHAWHERDGRDDRVAEGEWRSLKKKYGEVLSCRIQAPLRGHKARGHVGEKEPRQIIVGNVEITFDHAAQLTFDKRSEVFSGIRTSVRDFAPEVRETILARVDALEHAAEADSKSFGQKYSEFVATVADHVTIFAPLAPFMKPLADIASWVFTKLP